MLLSSIKPLKLLKTCERILMFRLFKFVFVYALSALLLPCLLLLPFVVIGYMASDAGKEARAIKTEARHEIVVAQ